MRRIARSGSISSLSSGYESDLDPIEETNYDSAVCRQAAADAGYFVDKYTPRIVGRACKKLPLINRGTWTRTFIIDSLIRQFVEKYGTRNNPAQIVSLGAGWDVRALTLMDNGLENFVYFEIDFERVLRRKIQKLRLSHGWHPIKFISGDLANFDDIIQSLNINGYDPQTPTFILAELVLIYLGDMHSDNIIKWFSKIAHENNHNENRKIQTCIAKDTIEEIYFGKYMFLSFEQTETRDTFGLQMIRNLESRGIYLRSLIKYPDLKSQLERYVSLGWDKVLVVNMLIAYRELINGETRQKIEDLEILDEIEEWELLCRHYGFTIAAIQ